ncbi:anti-sigma factor family protein, partial [Pseudomonadota bacterium]
MDKYKHTDPLALQSAELTERTPFCPEDQEIAEFFDGMLAEQARQKVEHHLADCRYCLARIGMLNRQLDDSLDTREPGDALATAKSLAKSTAPRRLKRAPGWAMAAVVLLGMFFIAVKKPSTEPETQR